MKEVEVIKEKGKNVFFFVLGCGVIGVEATLRGTTNVVSDLGETLADVHTSYVNKVRANGTLSKAVQVVEPGTIIGLTSTM